jgi:hypothetical protein
MELGKSWLFGSPSFALHISGCAPSVCQGLLEDFLVGKSRMWLFLKIVGKSHVAVFFIYPI